MFQSMMGGRVFEADYRAYSVGFAGKMEAEHGDKLILPQSALDKIAQLHVQYPITFKIENPLQERHSHCGVLEFTAEEGMVYMPYWMMQNLLLEEGSLIHLRNVSLPKGQYVKLQPHTSDFLDISNPKAVLEHTLRGYTCLTKGDTFVLEYNDSKYYIDVVDAKPQAAISVIETDCNVDFDPPKDYKEPERPGPSSGQANVDDGDAPPTTDADEPPPPPSYFTGRGFKLTGGVIDSGAPPPNHARSGVASTSSSQQSSQQQGGGIKTKDGQTKSGKVVFGGGNRLAAKLNQQQQPQAAPQQQSKTDESSEKQDDFTPFKGKPNKLR